MVGKDGGWSPGLVKGKGGAAWTVGGMGLLMGIMGCLGGWFGVLFQFLSLPVSSARGAAPARGLSGERATMSLVKFRQRVGKETPP